ncbi:hypothetical protein HY477_00230 [Candidatus Uhrbacteria bacterium]|nr:hypothetical protein [Candidatus Uhrbacteria bacterium]
MSTRTYFQATGTIFGLIAALHLLRLVFGWEAQIGSIAVPMWVSVIAVILAGYLFYQSFRLGKHSA